jgi:hypothetical protein
VTRTDAPNQLFAATGQQIDKNNTDKVPAACVRPPLKTSDATKKTKQQNNTEAGHI